MQKDEYLNEIEVEEVKKFTANKTMFEAVRKILLADVYFNGTLKAGEPAQPYRNALLGYLLTEEGNTRVVDNDQLATEVRTYAEGVGIIQRAFKKLEEYSKESPKPSKEEETGE